MKINPYKKGIKFKCQGSAKCCVSRGSYGYVYLSNEDVLRLTNYFSLSIKEFKKKYCKFSNGFLHLNEINKSQNCRFLKNKKCSIYSARPTQCRTWPFWPENIKAKIWNKEILNFCPGIGKGELISNRNIKRMLNIDLKNDQKTITN